MGWMEIIERAEGPYNVQLLHIMQLAMRGSAKEVKSAVRKMQDGI